MSSSTGSSNKRINIVRPTDFEILYVLTDGQRYTAPLVATILNRKPSYISNQMGDLAQQNLLVTIGKVDRCNLYRINLLGAVVLAHADVYTNNHAEVFTQKSRQLSNIIAEADSDFSGDETMACSADSHKPTILHPNSIYPDPLALPLLETVAEREPVTAREIAFATEERFADIADFLYQLTYYGLATQTDGEYRITDRGSVVLDLFEDEFDIRQLDYDTCPQLSQRLAERGVLEPPDWYQPEQYTEKALNPTLPSKIPDFTS